METGHGEPDSWLLFNLFGLDCVSLVVLLSSGLSPPIGVTNCESCLSLGSKVTDLNGTEMMWITLICLLLRGGPWGWMRQSGLDGPPCGLVGCHRIPQTLSPPPFS